MADFIAVIRRAVDGLTNNTPEMRAKVYDKARSAVLRQLENMSPRPPEEMIRRQMDKLTAAIEEVEAEHAVALPELDEPPVADPVFEPAPSPFAEPPQAPVHADEPDNREPAWVAEQRNAVPDERSDDATPLAEPEPYSGAMEPEPAHDPEPLKVRVAEPSAFEPPAPVAPAFATADDWTIEPEARVPATEELPQEQPAVDENEWLPPAEKSPAVINIFDPPAPTEPEPRGHLGIAENIEFVPSRPVEQDLPEPSPTIFSHDDSPFASPAAPVVDSIPDREPLPHTDSPPAYDAWPAQSPVDQKATAAAIPASDFDLEWSGKRDGAAVEDDFDRFMNSGKAEGPAMPPALDLLDWHSELASLPPLSGPRAAGATATDAATTTGPVAPAAKPPVQPTESSFDDLLGDGISRPTKRETVSGGGDIEDLLAAAQQKAYRQEPKPRRNFVPLILGLACFIVLAGGAYAVWLNRDTISDLVSEFTTPAPETPAVETTSTDAPASSQPAVATDTPVATETAAPANGAPEEGVASGQKFTQRLLADGTEIDEGAAGASGLTGEGRSVAAQTAPSTAPGEVPPPAASAPTNTQPPASTGVGPTGSQERAFLYEERLGQASPTAIGGGIEWTALRENGPDGRPDPAIQGRLTVPERGLNALITFRRNNDDSLPASHLVEIVFSMPPDFEGGAIDAVQRVAMKRTEQDRGDPLVGVAAKVTDDTFLIALNDFPDVVARNMDLLGTRNWIDIPVTYRNGRRALLTLDKGSNGTGLFQQVIREWAAIGG